MENANARSGHLAHSTKTDRVPSKKKAARGSSRRLASGGARKSSIDSRAPAQDVFHLLGNTRRDFVSHHLHRAHALAPSSPNDSPNGRILQSDFCIRLYWVSPTPAENFSNYRSSESFSIEDGKR